jgi:pimeloyl-ACP methyl ester carboxylesterase
MRIEVGDVGLEVQVAGPPDGRPVVLLHGFPDTGRVWRHQVEALEAAGFRLIVPDLRGYGGSDKPEAVEAYRVAELAGDVLGVLDHFGVARAHLVGHDWGAALGWMIATVTPERVDHLAVLSVGHPTSFRSAGFEQFRRSFYMLLFLFKGVGERWLSHDNWANFRRWADHPDADAVVADLEAHGSLTPALNYYRANIPAESWLADAPKYPPVQAPTMGIWSSDDAALTEQQMTGSADHVAGEWRYERIDGVGHWLQLEAAEAVNGLLLDFLPAPPDPPK